MAFMGPKLLSFLQIRMGYGKSSKFGSAKSCCCCRRGRILIFFLLFSFFLSFLRFWFTTTATWPVHIVPLPYWKLLAMNYPTLILNQLCLLWGTFSNLMEGTVLKLGLHPWPLSLCNSEICKIQKCSCFSICLYMFPQVNVKIYALMIYFSGITSSSYSLYLWSILTVSFPFILEEKRILGLYIVLVRGIKLWNAGASFLID